MNNTTPQPNKQAQMSPDALAATLAHATHLHEQLLPDIQHAPQASQEPQGNEQGQQVDNMADQKMGDLESKIDQKLEILRNELKGNQKLEIESLRNDIKQALSDEQEE